MTLNSEVVSLKTVCIKSQIDKFNNKFIHVFIKVVLRDLVSYVDSEFDQKYSNLKSLDEQNQ